MKKLVCIISTVGLIFGSIVPIAAYNEIKNEEVIVAEYARYKGHGEYEVCGNSMLNLESESMESGDRVGIIPTEDEEIYYISDNTYLVNAYNNTYLLSEKVQLDSQNYENNIVLFETHNVPENIKSDIAKVIATQKELGNKDFCIELFVPAKVISDVQVMANEPLGEVYYNYFYRNHVYEMKDYSVKYKNLSSGMIEKKGLDVWDYAKLFGDFIFSIPGVADEVIIPAFGVFESAYELYASIRGPVTRASSGDRIYTDLIFDHIVKYTYAPDPVYGDYPNAGCVSHKVWLNRHDTYQFYSETGESCYEEISLNQELFTPNFENPAPTAILNGISSSHVDSPITTEIFETHVILTGE